MSQINPNRCFASLRFIELSLESWVCDELDDLGSISAKLSQYRVKLKLWFQQGAPFDSTVLREAMANWRILWGPVENGAAAHLLHLVVGLVLGFPIWAQLLAPCATFAADFHDVSVVFLEDFYGISEGMLWEFCGILIRFPLDSYGISTVFLWCFYDISMGFLLDSCGISIGFLWDFQGISMMFLWSFYGIPVGFLWDSNDISMICLWNYYDISMRCLWDLIKGPDNPTRQHLPIMRTKCCSGDGERRKDKGCGGGPTSKTKLCVTKLYAKDGVWRRKMVCVTKRCGKDGVCESCVWKRAFDKVLCERWCVTKLCAKDCVSKNGVWQSCVKDGVCKMVCDKVVCDKAVCERWCVKDGVWQSWV